MIQLDLFEKNEVALILEEFSKIKDSQEKVRKKIFGIVAELQQEVKELKELKFKELKKVLETKIINE